MAELVVREKPDVVVFQQFEGETPLIRRPILQPAVVAQVFQLVGKLIPGEDGAVAGTYTGVELQMNYPDLLPGAEVDNFSSISPQEPDLLEEVVVEVDDTNGLFDVSDDDQTVIEPSGVTLGKALHTWMTILSGTVVTTGAGDTRLTFPAEVDLLALGVQIGDQLRFATLVSEIIDPTTTQISAEVDVDTGLAQEFDVIGIPSQNAVDVAILGESWGGFLGEANVQAEIRRYPEGEGVVVAPDPGGTGADIVASTTFTIVNGAVDFRDDPVLPGDCLRFTSLFEDIVGDAAIVIDNIETILTPPPTTQPPTSLPPTTPAGTTLPPTTPAPVIAGSGILGVGISIQAGKIFVDPDAAFITNGVTADEDVLRFITDEDDLDGTSGVVSVRNLDDLQIIEVISETSLRLANGLVTESPVSGKTFQYNVVKKNQVVTDLVNTGEFGILAVLGANSLLLDSSPTAEARTSGREFEFQVVRKRVVNGPVRISYRALRTDLAGTLVEVQADVDSSTTFLVSQLGPVLSLNPLSLMAALAVSQTTESIMAASVVHWTLEGVSLALDALASQPAIYGIAMGTHDPTFLSLLEAHVNKFSDPVQRNGMERYMVQSLLFPRQSVVVDTVDGAANALVVQAQRDRVVVPPTASWEATDALPNYVIDFDPNNTGRTVAFNVNGAVILRSEAKITAVIGSNTLQLLEEVDVSEGPTVSGPYRVLTQVRGLQENAQRIAQINASIANRRVDSLFPEVVEANVGGIEEELPSYYAAAAVVGLRASLTASLPLTFRGIAGLSGTVGGQGIYSEFHFNIMAGGGTWILFQDAFPEGPVLTRHQLTTDIASLERSEDSIRTALDYGAKLFRSELRPLIGRVNLTDEFIQQELRPRVEGILQSLIDDDIFGKSSSIFEVIRDPVKKDTARIKVRVETLKPFNYADVIFVIN